MQQPRTVPALHAGAGQLPSNFDDGLLKGGMYSLRVESTAARYSVILHALSTNARRGVHCTLITSATVDDLIRYADVQTIGLLQRALEEGRLSVLAMIGDYATNIFRYGPQQFVGELETLGTSANGFLLIDRAEDFFTVDDARVAAQQAAVYQAWVRHTHTTALFLFFDSDGPSAYLHRLSDYFNGLAGMYFGAAGLEIGIDYWGVQQGVILAKRLAVTIDEDGLRMQPCLAVNRRCEVRTEQDNAAVRRLRFQGSDTVEALDRNGDAATSHQDHL